MTKLTFDVDFNKDPEEILKEIQERAKAEVAKRESKIKYAAFLSKLHEKVNEEIGTEFKSINDLIRALTQFANPKLKEKISSSETGRRVTISMTAELFREIKSKLAHPNPNKAAIARETGASVVQVRKVASGGYDQKFSEEKSFTPSTPSRKNLERGEFFFDFYPTKSHELIRPWIYLSQCYRYRKLVRCTVHRHVVQG